MNKTELIAAAAKAAQVSKKDATNVINAALESIGAAMAKGQNVQLIGFGTFQVRKRTSRTGKNPRTGETIKIAATKVPSFKAGKGLKETVNRKKK